jgi:hypothetical protein
VSENMMDENRVWLVPENEEEEKRFESLVDKLTNKQTIMEYYKTVKELLKMDFILFGNDNSGDVEISGAVNFNGKILRDKDFHSEVIIQTKYFKQLFKYLTKDTKLNRHTMIEFHFQSGLPLIVVIDNTKAGVIAPYMGDF